MHDYFCLSFLIRSFHCFHFNLAPQQCPYFQRCEPCFQSNLLPFNPGIKFPCLLERRCGVLLPSTPSLRVVAIHAVLACHLHAMLVDGKASTAVWPARHRPSALCRRRPRFVALIGLSWQVRVGPNEAGLSCVWVGRG